MKKCLSTSKDQIANILHNYWQNRFNLLIFGSSFLLNIILCTILYFKIGASNKYKIPLHYNVYFGIDIVDEWYKVFIIPGIGLIILIVNLFLSILIFEREKLASYILSSTNLIVQFFLIITGITIILINK